MSECHAEAERIFILIVPRHSPMLVYSKGSVEGVIDLHQVAIAFTRLPLLLRWRGIGRGALIRGARIPVQIIVTAVVRLLHGAPPPPKLALRGFLHLSYVLLNWNIRFQEF